MARKPDLAKSAGALMGFYLGSGDRGEAIERLRRWVRLAEERLSTEGIDQMAYRIVIYLNAEAIGREDWGGKWLRQWNAEVEQDKREHGQARIHLCIRAESRC